MRAENAPMRLMKLTLLFALLTSCGPDRPENAIVTEFGCLELQHVGGWYESGQAHFGEIVVRSKESEDCPQIAQLEFQLFADANGNGNMDGAETLMSGFEQYTAFVTNTRIYPTAKEVERGSGPLWYRVIVTDSSGQAHVNVGPCEE